MNILKGIRKNKGSNGDTLNESFIKVEPKQKYGLKSGTRIRTYGFDKIFGLNSLNESMLQSNFKKKRWVKKVSLERDERGIFWSYPGKKPLLITEDGFYIRYPTSEEDFKAAEISAWRIGSILNGLGLVSNWHVMAEELERV